MSAIEDPSSPAGSGAVRLRLIDTHAHLDVDDFAADLDPTLDRARQAGVEAMICPAVTAQSSRDVVRLAQTRPECFAAVGIQPNSCAGAAADDWGQIESLVAEPRVIAVGETGLDRYWDFTPLELQQEYFDRHLRLAQTRSLPVIIHCRDAEADLLPMLREAARRAPLSGVLHSFSGDRPMAQECQAMGLYVSFSGSLTYTNRKFDALRAVAAAIAGDRLLVETDSPYLTPHPLRGKQKRNEPANLPLTLRCLAHVRGQSPEELAAQTTANARRLFRLP